MRALQSYNLVLHDIVQEAKIMQQKIDVPFVKTFYKKNLHNCLLFEVIKFDPCKKLCEKVNEKT